MALVGYSVFTCEPGKKWECSLSLINYWLIFLGFVDTMTEIKIQIEDDFGYFIIWAVLWFKSDVVLLRMIWFIFMGEQN